MLYDAYCSTLPQAFVQPCESAFHCASRLNTAHGKECQTEWRCALGGQCDTAVSCAGQHTLSHDCMPCGRCSALLTITEQRHLRLPNTVHLMLHCWHEALLGLLNCITLPCSRSVCDRLLQLLEALLSESSERRAALEARQAARAAQLQARQDQMAAAAQARREERLQVMGHLAPAPQPVTRKEELEQLLRYALSESAHSVQCL